MSSNKRNVLIVALLIVVMYGGWFVWRSFNGPRSPEAERAEKAFRNTGWAAADPNQIPTEPGASTRIEVRQATGAGRPLGPPQTCLVTVGETVDAFDVTECSPVP